MGSLALMLPYSRLNLNTIAAYIKSETTKEGDKIMESRFAIGDNIYSTGPNGFEKWYVRRAGRFIGPFRSAGDAMRWEYNH